MRTAATHQPSSPSRGGQPVRGRDAALGLLAVLALLALVAMLAASTPPVVTLGPWGAS
jgi:hypothetical protein